MCTNSICRSTHHARKCRLVSSGPLSQRIAKGCPRSATIASSTRVTLRLVWQRKLDTAIVITPHARRWLKAYSSSTCSTAAFRATSSTRFFESPTAALPCPGSDPPPASAAACSPHATASLPAPGSHPSPRTSPSPRRLCALRRPLPAPLPRKFVLNAPTAKLPHPHPLLGMIKQPLYFFSKISHVVRAIAVYGCFLCAESAFSPFELHNRLPKSHVFHDFDHGRHAIHRTWLVGVYTHICSGEDL